MYSRTRDSRGLNIPEYQSVGRSGVHVVGTNSTNLCLGHYIAYSNNVSKVGGTLIATRIA